MWVPARVAILVAAVGAVGCGRFRFDPSQRSDGAMGGGGDGPRDSGPSAACTAAEVCSDFEGPSVPPPWMTDPMVSLDTAHAHSGTQSIHVHSPALAAGSGSYELLFEPQTISANINPYWVRAWFWLSLLPATGNAMELMTAEHPGNNGDYVFVHSDRTAVYSQYDSKVMSTSTIVPSGAWFCLVWKVTRNIASTGALELSGDVTVSLTGTVTDSTSSPLQYVVLGIGYSTSNVVTAQPAQDLWIDDVIVSASAVTCAD